MGDRLGAKSAFGSRRRKARPSGIACFASCRAAASDILIALIDGLTGLPDALQAVFPHTVIHQCIVHLVRQRLHYVSWTERKLVAAALRAIYQAPTDAAGRLALQRSAESPLGLRHAPIVTIWERHWERIAPALAYPPEIRRELYTTNAIERLNMQIRKVIKSGGHFPSDEAAGKLLYLALRNIGKKWKVKLGPTS